MMDKKMLDEAFNTVASTLGKLRMEFSQMNAITEALPKTEGELNDLLTELAAAAEDKAGHHKRFPRREGQGTYESDGFSIETVRSDWYRCMDRFDKVVSKLVKFAQMNQQKAA